MNDTCEDYLEKLGSVTEVGAASDVVIERPEVVEEASGNTYSFADDEDVGVGDGRKRRTEVKEHEERRITDGVIWMALASRVTGLLMPCCPKTKPFCWSSAQSRTAGAILRLTTAAMVLLSVFLRPSGRVLSAVRLTLVVVSSSAEPLGRKIPRLELKSPGRSVLHIMESWARFRVR